MENQGTQGASEFLHMLVNQPLCYGLKSTDMDLYEFGFGTCGELREELGQPRMICTLFLHITCRFKVICKNGTGRVDRYHEDTPCRKFHTEIKKLIGLIVKRVELSDKNDLWLDFGDYWVVFATFENGEESWRFFTSDNSKPHLVASDLQLFFM